jgi:NodT family efflux transporter outer membrane factor (OMF) lipoprotein
MKFYSVKLIILMSALFWLYGCAKTPSPTTTEVAEQALPETTKVPEDWTSKGNEKLPDQTLNGLAGPVEDGWIKSFKDPQLESLVQEAVNHNPGLRIAAANVDRAAAVAVISGAALKPSVGAGAAGEKSYGGSLLDTDAWGVGMAWEIDLWGKLRARAAAGEAAYEVSVADYNGARQSLAALTAKAWFLLTEAYQQRSLIEESVSIYEKMLSLAESRYKIGKVSKQDIHLARADFSSANERLRQMQTAFEQAARSLEILLGRYPNAEINAGKEFVAMPPAIPVGLPSDILQRRYDLISAEKQVAAAFQQIIEAEAARLPSLSLTATGGRVSNDLNNLLGSDPGFFNVGANFLAPIFTGGSLEAQVEITEANQEVALAAYGQTALTAFSEVERSLRNETLIMEREAFLVDVVTDNNQALKLAQKQYQVGRTDMLNVLINQARLIGAKASLISIQNDRLTNRVNLHLALGGDFEEFSAE